MQPHGRVHGRGYDQRSGKGQGLGRKHLIRHACGQTGERGGAGRGYQHGMGRSARLKMAEGKGFARRFLIRREHAGIDRVSAQGGEAQGRDKAGGGFGQRHADQSARLLQRAHNIHRLVGGDRAADSKVEAAALERGKGRQGKACHWLNRCEPEAAGAA